MSAMQHDNPFALRYPGEEGPFPALRFGVGERVEVVRRKRHGEQAGMISWEPGVVHALFWCEDERCPPGKCCPYVVNLDHKEEGAVASFVPVDEECCIRVCAAPPLKIEHDGPVGLIDPRADPDDKAMAYVDLLLSGDGEAMLAGEPAMINMQLGQRGLQGGPLMACYCDELELVSSIVGLSNIGEAVPGELVLAMYRRAPASLAALCAFIAFTPELGEEDERTKDGCARPSPPRAPRSPRAHAIRARRRGVRGKHQECGAHRGARERARVGRR